VTGRERILAALSPQGSPQAPAAICYEGIYVRDHWDQLTDLPWWYQFESDVDRQVVWRREMLTRTGMDWFELPLGYSRADR